MLLPLVCMAGESFKTNEPSPLKLDSFEKERNSTAKFTGEVILSGGFSIGWAFIDGEPFDLVARLYPDNSSLKLLPHAVSSGNVKELRLSDAKNAAKSLLNTEQAKKLLSKEIVTINGSTTVKVSNYTTAIDCDRRWYMADLVEVIAPPLVAKASVKELELRC